MIGKQTLIGLVFSLSIFLMLVITERTDRPFATSLFSKKTFIMGLDGDPNRTDTFDMSVSRAGFRNDLEKKRTTATNSLLTKELTRDTQDDTRNSMFDRTLIVTPTSQERDEDDLPNPTVPALPAMPEWRQKRDTALRNTLRVEDNRSLAVPSPLTAVYGAAPSPNSLTKYGSQFSWRPPTRDSMISARNTRDLEEEYRNNWPPAEMLQQAKSPNRASMPAPSQPPTVPLPPLVPRSEVTDSAAPTNLVEGAKEPDSQRSSETVSILMEITSTKIPETQPTSITDEVATSMAAEERQPAEEAPRPRGRRPALPSLEKLSARAAARHKRVPTLDPDVNQAPSTNTASDEATKTESSRSSPESLEPRRTEVKSRSNQSEDIDDSGFESEDDTGPEEPRRSRRSLLRSNTAGPRLVRNFSRPRIPSSMLNRRRPSKGNLPPAAFKTGGGEGQSSSSGSRRDNDSGGSSFTGIKQQFRRSRSLPAVRDRKADTTAAATEVDTERKTIVEVNPEFKVTVPILQPAPVRNTSRAREAQQKKAPPRFSPFPSAATSMAPEKKVKGLGQGSQRRLGQRVNQWRDGVDTTQDALAAQQAEIDAQQRQLLEDFDLMGRTSIVEGGRRPSIDSRRLSTDGRRPSMENRGRQPARPDVLGLPAKPHPVSKLSRDKSMNGRGRHVAQNF